MNRRGHAGRVDENQLVITRALFDAGCSVQTLAAVGLGCPDLLVGMAGVNILLEVKNPAAAALDRKLTPDQKKWHAQWKGHVETCETPAEALDCVKRILRISHP